MKKYDGQVGTSVPVLSNKGDDISKLTPEQREERKRKILQAMRNYRVDLANAIRNANPGLEKLQ